MSLPRRLWRLARQSARSLPFSPNGDSAAARARREAERELAEFLGAASAAEAAAPPPSPPHPFERQYRTLNTPVGSDAETVEKAWRRLVLQNHPDRFADDPAAERAATERLRQINEAHAELIAWLRRNGKD